MCLSKIKSCKAKLIPCVIFIILLKCLPLQLALIKIEPANENDDNKN